VYSPSANYNADPLALSTCAYYVSVGLISEAYHDISLDYIWCD
jgi:hypothetical protein